MNTNSSDYAYVEAHYDHTRKFYDCKRFTLCLVSPNSQNDRTISLFTLRINDITCQFIRNLIA